jgi:hypothetical protein
VTWFGTRGAHRAPGAGRDGQGPGRHTVEHVERHRDSHLVAVGQPADGMAPVGAAGRQSLDDLYGGPFRGAGSLA